MKSLLAREMRCSRRKIYVGDAYLAPIKNINFGRFLVKDATDSMEYIENVCECNFFALNFVRNAKRFFMDEFGINAAIGMLWTIKTWRKESHAFNFYIRHDMKVRYIEPQTDQEVFLTNDEKVIFVYI